MVNVELLLSRLESGNCTLDEGDDAIFQSIVSFVEKGEFEMAAPLIEEGFQQGRIDIRMTAYYLYTYFLQENTQSLTQIFPILNSLLDKHWDLLVPLAKKDRHVQKSLSWLFSKIDRSFEHIDRSLKKGEEALLLHSLSHLAPHTIQEIIETAQTLNDSLTRKWEHSSLNDQLLHLVNWIQELSKIFTERKEIAPQPSAEVSPAAPITKAEEIPEESIPWSLLEPSEPLKLIYQKLLAFQSLLEKKEFKKAAIIADDMEHLLQNFNPLVYFPKLFLQHFSLHAKYADKIDENREGGSYKILEKLYQTDLNAFIQWNR